jgi:hypothetical protein
MIFLVLPLDRGQAPEDVPIDAANRRQRDANCRFNASGMWTFNLFDANVVHATENRGPQLSTP